MHHDHVFMGQALKLAEEALWEGEFPVGCVVTLNDQILVQSRRQDSRGRRPSEIHHAEILALRELETRLDRKERQLTTLYVTLEPCLMCYAAILLSGIGRLVWAYEDAMGGGTTCNLAGLPPLYAHSTLEIRPRFRREESLTLFRTYFRDPSQSYWQGSLLASYTLLTE